MSHQSRTFEGRTAAEAAIKACEEFGLTRSELRYEVLSDVGEGLERRVVIQVHVDAGAAERRRDESPTQERPESAQREVRRQRRPRGEDSGRSAGPAPRGARGGHGGRGRPRREEGGVSRERVAEGLEGMEELLDVAPVGVGQVAEPRRGVVGAVSAKATRASQVVGDLTRLMALDVAPRVVVDGTEEIQIDLVGPGEARAIGKNGDVLLSLQFIVNRIVSHGERSEESDQVVVLDALGYRGRRQRALEELAQRLAARAKAERKVVRLSAMSAHDRRIFHVTLKGVDGVTTRSEGDGLYRKMLIIPSDRS